MTARENKFGRKPGRGIRPWLLLPKVIAVGLYTGGLSASLLVWTATRSLQITSMLVEFLVIPALLLSLLFGLLLLLQHPGVFLRMRWLIAKLVALAILIPAAHFCAFSRMALYRREPTHAATHHLTGIFALTLAASIGLVILGRLKPRLGRNPAAAVGAAASEPANG